MPVDAYSYLVCQKRKKKIILSDISKKRFDFFVGVLDFSACSEPILYVQIRIDIPPHLCINNLEALQINGFWRNRHIFPTTPQKPKYRHRHSKNSKITNLSNLQLIDMSVFRVFALLTRSFVYLWNNQSPNNYWTFRVKKKFLFFFNLHANYITLAFKAGEGRCWMKPCVACEVRNTPL